MKTATKIIAMALVLTVLMPAPEASAQISDITHMLGKFTTAISKVSKTVQKGIEAVGNSKTIKSIGKGISGIKKGLDSARAEFEKQKQSYEKEKQSIEDAKKVAADAKQQAADIAAQKAKIEAQSQDIKTQLNALDEQRQLLTAKADSDAASLTATANAQLANLDSNNKIYQQMIASDPSKAKDYQAVIDSNNAQKDTINLSLQESLAQVTADKQKILSSIDSQTTTLTNSLSGLLGIGSGSSAVADALFSQGADAKAANEATAAQMFLTKDQILTPENMDKMNINRNHIALQDTVDSVSQSMKLKLAINPSNDFGQSTKENTALQDGTTDALIYATTARIEEMNVLLNIIRLKALDLQAETSAEIIGMSRYQLVTYAGDQSTIDLCDYQKTPSKSAGAKK